MKLEPRLHFGLRRALDRTKEALGRRDLDEACRALLTAAGCGPLAARPTRMLWWLVARCLRRGGAVATARLEPLFGTDEIEERILAGNDRRSRRLHDLALECYQEALQQSPLCPEAIYRVGLTHFDLGDWTDAQLWLRLVPEIVGFRARPDTGVDGDPGGIAVRCVADSWFRLARIALARGHVRRSVRLILDALSVKPDFTAALELVKRAVSLAVPDGDRRDWPTGPWNELDRLHLELISSATPGCPICRAGLDPLESDPVVRCLRCDTPHHASCFSYNGRCSAYPCRSETTR
ncbi:MAG: tetratricopeptide repeat protein [Candidatus Riflebacteria bacterium]|nr:tetratricopeptide repeat protein [Candidatus Riflebacteria bacterium]